MIMMTMRKVQCVSMHFLSSLIVFPNNIFSACPNNDLPPRTLCHLLIPPNLLPSYPHPLPSSPFATLSSVRSVVTPHPSQDHTQIPHCWAKICTYVRWIWSAYMLIIYHISDGYAEYILDKWIFYLCCLFLNYCFAIARQKFTLMSDEYADHQFVNEIFLLLV